MEGSEAVLHFSRVYIHQTEGVPGVEVRTCWTQAVTIFVGEGVVQGSLSDPPTDLSDGYLKIDGELFDLIPIPLDQAGKIELKIEGWQEDITRRLSQRV